MSHNPLPPPSDPRPGFYPAGQGAMRLWDGQRWTEVTRPMPSPEPQQQPQVTYSQRVSAGGYVSGMTGPQHIFHAVLTVLTFGLWAPVWILMYLLGRKKVQ